jgi:glyoxylase-like metal-dependent hydrolase (beta-lactamase superfamily II)
MYGLERVAPDLHRIVLPGIPGCAGPWAQAANVWVVGGRRPVVIDTGHRSLRPSLLAALSDLGVAPQQVSKVLLTSLRPESSGNAEIFERATVHASDPDHRRLRLKSLWDEIAAASFEAPRALCSRYRDQHGWSRESVEDAQQAYRSEVSVFDVLPVADEQSVVTTVGDFELMQTAGAETSGASWYLHDRRWLFTGHSLVTRVDPLWQNIRKLTAGVTRVVKTTPALILPGFGPIERSAPVLFRSVSLQLNNLLTNLPSALDKDRSAAEIAARDLGYWPRDVIRFGATAQRFALILDELVAGGIAVRDGEGVTARYSLDTRAQAS